MQRQSILRCVLAILTLGAVTVPACAGSDSHEEVVVEMVAVMEEFNAVVAEVEDDASAKAAEGELQELLDGYVAALVRLERLGEPSPEDWGAVMEEHGEELEEVMDRFVQSVIVVGLDPRIQLENELGEAMAAMESTALPSTAGAGRRMSPDDAAAEVAELEEEWQSIQEAERALAARRSEVAELRAREPGSGENLETLEDAIESESGALARRLKDFIERAVPLQESVGGMAVEPRVAELVAQGIRVKSDEDIRVAEGYLERGDYDRALRMLESALELDPEYDRLEEKLARAREHRYMDRERFSRVEEGMSRSEVEEILGPVNLRNQREYPEKGELAWYYPKGESGEAAGVFFVERGDGWVVTEADFDAVP